MGCPTTQKDSQNIMFPMDVPGYFRYKNFVIATRGICIIMPMNDHGLIM
jgi:hypothetical protein